MTTKFKEIDLTKEFEYNGYEYELDYVTDKFKFYVDFHYSPDYKDGVKHKQNACVSVVEIYMDNETKKDLYSVIDDRVLARVEKHILEDLMK